MASLAKNRNFSGNDLLCYGTGVSTMRHRWVLRRMKRCGDTWPRRSALAASAVALLAALLASCAALRSYDASLARTLDLVSVGDVNAALDQHKRQHGGRKDLLYYLEQGELLRLAGRYDESQRSWFEADRMVGEWEDSARLDPDRLLGDVGSLLINDKSRPYTGQDFEKVMLTTRMALNHLALGEWDRARVAIKRTHEREALIASLREKQVRAAEEQAQEKEGQTRDFRELNGYPVQTIDNPEVNALRNSYQSAFSHYLAGFVYEALGETSLAAAGYRQAIELRPGIELLAQGLAGLDARAYRRGESGETDLLVVVETGRAPARSSVTINLPVLTDQGLLPAPVSFPVLRQESGANSLAEVSADAGEGTRADVVTSVDLMARRALQDDMPWIVLRAVARATAKVSLQRVALKQDDSGLAGAIAIIGSVVTEQADERSWRSLPADIAIARMRLPRGVHEVDIDVANQRQRYSVNLDAAHAVMTVRQIGNSAYMSLSPGPRAGS